MHTSSTDTRSHTKIPPRTEDPRHKMDGMQNITLQAAAVHSLVRLIIYSLRQLQIWKQHRLGPLYHVCRCNFTAHLWAAGRERATGGDCWREEEMTQCTSPSGKRKQMRVSQTGVRITHGHKHEENEYLSTCGEHPLCHHLHPPSTTRRHEV